MASEYTENYNLDLYASADKPNLRDQYNAAMGKIDKELKTVADSNTANTNLLSQLNRDFEGVRTSADSASAAATAASTAASNAEKAAEEAKAEAESATEKATEVEGKLSGYAPVKHDSAQTTYGVGNGTNFGHVKLTDSPSALDDATSGTAASGKSVSTLNTTVTGLNTTVTGIDTRVKALEQGGGGGDYAPTNHASAQTTYGQGNASNFGHVKLTDAYNASSSNAASGIAASGAALNSLNTHLTGEINSVNTALNQHIGQYNAAPNSCGSTTSNAGFTANASTFFHRNGVVVVKVNLTLSSSFNATGANVQFGTISAGYRPTAQIRTACYITGANQGVASAQVNANGNVEVQVVGLASTNGIGVVGEVVYLAGVQ